MPDHRVIWKADPWAQSQLPSLTLHALTLILHVRQSGHLERGLCQRRASQISAGCGGWAVRRCRGNGRGDESADLRASADSAGTVWLSAVRVVNAELTALKCQLTALSYLFIRPLSWPSRYPLVCKCHLD